MELDLGYYVNGLGYGSPLAGHNETTNVLFTGGHVKAMRPFDIISQSQTLYITEPPSKDACFHPLCGFPN